MKLPFTTQQFLEVFKAYNSQIFPLQLVFLALALSMTFLVFIRAKKVDKFVMFILSGLWLWMGVVYHIGFFSAINKGWNDKWREQTIAKKTPV